MVDLHLSHLGIIFRFGQIVFLIPKLTLDLGCVSPIKLNKALGPLHNEPFRLRMTTFSSRQHSFGVGALVIWHRLVVALGGSGTTNPEDADQCEDEQNEIAHHDSFLLSIRLAWVVVIHHSTRRLEHYQTNVFGK